MVNGMFKGYYSYINDTQDSTKEKLDYMRNSRDNFNKIFNTISTDYDDYLNTIREMVGGNNGNK